MPHNCGDFNPWSTRRVNLYEFTWLVYIIDSLDRNIGVWHESITLLILPDRNIRSQYIRYTKYYILKLQLHQKYWDLFGGFQDFLFSPSSFTHWNPSKTLIHYVLIFIRRRFHRVHREFYEQISIHVTNGIWMRIVHSLGFVPSILLPMTYWWLLVTIWPDLCKHIL